MSKQLSCEVRDRDISSIRKGETLDLEEHRIAWLNKICEEAKEHDFTCLRDLIDWNFSPTFHWCTVLYTLSIHS